MYKSVLPVWLMGVKQLFPLLAWWQQWDICIFSHQQCEIIQTLDGSRFSPFILFLISWAYAQNKTMK